MTMETLSESFKQFWIELGSSAKKLIVSGLSLVVLYSPIVVQKRLNAIL